MFVELDTIRWLWPEIVLVILASWIYVGHTFRQDRLAWTIVAAAAYVVAGFALFWQVWTSGPEFWIAFQAGQGFSSGPLSIDFLGTGIRWLAVAMGLLFTLVGSQLTSRESAGEFFATLMLLVVGIMLVASADELVLLFVGLELISIPTYVLLVLGRRGRANAEASAKYFFLSIFSSAILLYGLSFLYGVTGTTNLSQVELPRIAAASAGGMSHLLPSAIAMVLILSGLGFKIAAVPFHFYAPDVYQGTTNANAGLLAVAPKIGGIVALVRLTFVLAPHLAEFAWQMTIVLCVLSMTIGNICALWQTNVRRLMAYSSIAHAGYMLIGLAAGLAAPESGGVAATLLYLLVYVLASLGTFAALAYLGSEESEVGELDELAGLGRRQPAAAGAIAVCMFSLAGIPPLAGFWGKLSLFAGAITVWNEPLERGGSLWFIVLAVAGAINAAIAAAYYLRVVSVMFFRAPTSEVPAKGGIGAWSAMAACCVLVLLIGFLPGQFVRFADIAGKAAIRKKTGAEWISTAEPQKQRHVLQARAERIPADSP